jgi:hypothetical protein
MKSWAESRGGTYKRSGNLLLLNNGTDLIASAYSLDDIVQYCYLDSKPDEVDEIRAKIESKIMDIARSNRAKLNDIRQISLINRADINTLNSISEIEGAVIDVLLNKVIDLKSQVIENTTSITSLIALLQMNGVMDRIEPAEDPKEEDEDEKTFITNINSKKIPLLTEAAVNCGIVIWFEKPSKHMTFNRDGYVSMHTRCKDLGKGCLSDFWREVERINPSFWKLTPEPADDPEKPLTLADCKVGMELECVVNGDILTISTVDKKERRIDFTTGDYETEKHLHNYRIHSPAEDPKVHKHMGNGYPVCGANFYQSAYLVHKDDWSKVTCPDCLKHKPKPKLKIIHIPEDIQRNINSILDYLDNEV